MDIVSNNLRLDHLERCFQYAKENNANYIGVAIQTRGNEGLEIIINPKENFESKLEYYKKAYTQELVLKTYDGIKIVGFTYGDDFKEIQEDLLDQED